MSPEGGNERSRRTWHVYATCAHQKDRGWLRGLPDGMQKNTVSPLCLSWRTVRTMTLVILINISSRFNATKALFFNSILMFLSLPLLSRKFKRRLQGARGRWITDVRRITDVHVVGISSWTSCFRWDISSVHTSTNWNISMLLLFHLSFCYLLYCFFTLIHHQLALIKMERTSPSAWSH